MIQVENPNNAIYWIFYDEDKSNIHHGKTNPGQYTTTGLLHDEQFNDKQTWLDRLNELGVSVVEDEDF